MCIRDSAQAVVDAVKAFGGDLPLLLLPGSVALRTAEKAGLRAVPEAFADRGYTPEATLVSRRDPGAVSYTHLDVYKRQAWLRSARPRRARRPARPAPRREPSRSAWRP